MRQATQRPNPPRDPRADLERLAKLIGVRLEPILARSPALTGEHSMLTQKDVCAYIKMSRTQFYHLRRGDKRFDNLPPFPTGRYNGSCTVWRRKDVDRWLSQLPESA